jgi:hypothetical protein
MDASNYVKQYLSYPGRRVKKRFQVLKLSALQKTDLDTFKIHFFPL